MAIQILVIIKLYTGMIMAILSLNQILNHLKLFKKGFMGFVKTANKHILVGHSLLYPDDLPAKEI